MLSSFLLSIVIGCSSQEKQATPTSETEKTASEKPSNDDGNETNRTKATEDQATDKVEDKTQNKVGKSKSPPKPSIKKTQKIKSGKGRNSSLKPKLGPGVKKGKKR